MNRCSGEKVALGKHMTVEYYDCDMRILNSPEKMKEIFLRAAKDSGATVLDSNFHLFEPQGVSGIVVISESHFAVHAWPEFDYAAVDIFTCGDVIDFDAAVESLQKGMKSKSVVISSVMYRGVVGNNGFERLVPLYKEDQGKAYSLSWKKRYDEVEAWGMLSAIDVYGCDREIIETPEKVAEVLKSLILQFGFSGNGEVDVTSFDHKEKGASFTVSLPIKSGMLSGQISCRTGALYLDVFSCNFYEPREIAEQAIQSFGGKRYRMQVTLRH